jgi:hypothetical protein
VKGPKIIPEIRLNGDNGNAFAILCKVTKELIKAGADNEYVKKYLNEATAGDYDHLLGVTMKYVDVF